MVHVRHKRAGKKEQLICMVGGISHTSVLVQVSVSNRPVP